jgi:hypothetical protein
MASVFAQNKESATKASPNLNIFEIPHEYRTQNTFQTLWTIQRQTNQMYLRFVKIPLVSI